MNLLRQRREEWQFDFLLSTPGGSYEEEAKTFGCGIYYHPDTSGLAKRLHMLGLAKNPYAYESVIRRNSYDVVHAHGTEFLGEVMKIAAVCSVPVRVAHCHTTGIGRFRKSAEMMIRGIRFRTLDRHCILKYATDIVACSRESGRFFTGRHWDDDARSKTLFCGVSLDVFRDSVKRYTRAAFRSSHGIPPDAVVVGHAGSMGPTPVKNHSLILKIFGELAKRDRRYFLYLAGDGPLRSFIEGEIERHGLRARVIMPGLFKDIPSLMVHGFDVHLLPSLYEGLPVVGLEATACGLFTVCSDTITRDFTGYFRERVAAVPLDAPVGEWADEVEKAAGKRIAAEDGITLLDHSPFSIRASSDSLLDLYQSRLYR